MSRTKSPSVNDGNGNRQFHDEFGNENGDKIGSYGYTDTNGMYRKVNYIADDKGFKVKVHSNEMPPPAGVKEGTIDPRINPVINPSASSSSNRGYIQQYEPVQSESNEDNIHIFESRRGQIKPLIEVNEPPINNHQLNYYSAQPKVNYVTTKKPTTHGSALFGSYYKSLRQKSHEQDQVAADRESEKEEFESDFGKKFKRVPKYQMPNDGRDNNNNQGNTIIISSNAPYITEGLRKSNNYVEDPSIKPYLPRAIKMVKLKSYKKVDPRDLKSEYSVNGRTNYQRPQLSPPTHSPKYFQSHYHQQQLRHQQLQNPQPTNYGVTIDHGHQQINHNVIKTYPKAGASPYFDDADWLRSLTTTTPAPKVESHFSWYPPKVENTKPAPQFDHQSPIVRRPSAPLPSSAEEDRFLSDHALFEKRSKLNPSHEKGDNLNTIESSNEIIQNELEGKYYGHVPFGARISAMGNNNNNLTTTVTRDQKVKSDDLKRFYLHYESTRDNPIERVPSDDLNRTRSKEDQIIHLTYNKMIPKVHYDLEHERLFSDHKPSYETDGDGHDPNTDNGIDDNVISKRVDEGNEISVKPSAPPTTERKKFSYAPYEPPITSKDTVLDKWSARIWPPPTKKE